MSAIHRAAILITAWSAVRCSSRKHLEDATAVLRLTAFLVLAQYGMFNMANKNALSIARKRVFDITCRKVSLGFPLLALFSALLPALAHRVGRLTLLAQYSMPSQTYPIRHAEHSQSKDSFATSLLNLP